MLPKTRRISRKEFPFILQNGKRLNSPRLLLHIAKPENNSPSRFSFSVSKKICKKAVDRNKLRRRGYFAVSKIIDRIKNGHYFFFSFKKYSGEMKFSEMEKEIIGLLNSAGVLS